MIRHKHTLPNHAMLCQPCLGLAWRGEQARACVWGKVLYLDPLRHVLTPTAIWTGPSFSKLGPAAPIFFINHSCAVANTYVHETFDGCVRLTFWGKCPPN